MKLSVSCIFALAQSAPEKREGLEQRTSLVPCRNKDFDGGSVISWNEYQSGYRGSINFQQYKDNQYCYIEIGTPCETGVEAEFSYVQLESPTSRECHYDWVHFTYTDEKGRPQQTNNVCGCYPSTGYSNPCDMSDALENSYVQNYFTIKQMSPMAQATKYVMEGTNHRLIFKSDDNQSGGDVQLDWQCLPEPTKTPPTVGLWSTTTSFPEYGTTTLSPRTDYPLPTDFSINTEPITNVADMAQARLTRRFKPSMAVNYGCAGRGYFDPFDRTIGKQVDETDKAFYSWKKCVQCALSDDGVTPLTKPDGNIPLYQYDESTDTCGK